MFLRMKERGQPQAESWRETLRRGHEREGRSGVLRRKKEASLIQVRISGQSQSVPGPKMQGKEGDYK